MLESGMRRKSHVPFGGGQLEKGQYWHLASCLPYYYYSLLSFVQS